MSTPQPNWLRGTTRPAMATLPAHLSLYMNDATYSTNFLPVVIEGEQYAVISYCLGSGRLQDEEQAILPPFATLYVRYPDKTFRWKEVTPADYPAYGLVDLPIDEYQQSYIGRLAPYAAGITEEALENAQSEYLRLICLVLERGWLLSHQSITDEEQTAARELQQHIGVVYDTLLLPYYQHVGRDFFAWMTRAAQ
jgi:hypothetical protein